MIKRCRSGKFATENRNENSSVTANTYKKKRSFKTRAEDQNKRNSSRSYLKVWKDLMCNCQKQKVFKICVLKFWLQKKAFIIISKHHQNCTSHILAVNVNPKRTYLAKKYIGTLYR